MADADKWNLARVGKAAAVTTEPGTPSQYGLAMDLGMAQWQSSDQFKALLRDMASRVAAQQIEHISSLGGVTPYEIQLELQRAQNYASTGFGMTDDQFLNSGDDDASWLMQQANNVMTGVNLFKSSAGGMLDSLIDDPSKMLAPFQGGDMASIAGPLSGGATDYAAYRANGGILSEDQFNEFPEQTRRWLVARGYTRSTLADIADTPGIKHMLIGLDKSYRGLQVPFQMVGNQRSKNPLANILDPMWFQPGEYAKAWREAQDQSLGNAIVNSILEPYVGQDRIDDWKRSNSVYQLSSIGVELGAGWYLDAGVIGSQAIGGTARLARGELPLRETSKLYRATTQALQRERITVRGARGKLGQWRANSISHRWDDVREFARNSTYAEFSDLPMFRKRDAEGQSAAHALYWAFREAPDSGVTLDHLVNRAPNEQVALNYPDIPSLTQQLLHGDPKAYADLRKLQTSAPVELEKFAPGAQTFIDAIEATKTKIPLLQKEADELAKVEPNSPFHEWSIHTEIDQRVKDIQEATEHLNKYAGYGKWLDSVSRVPTISRVGAPKRNFYMDNQFGLPHRVVQFTRPVWIQKANVMQMHDLDMGAESIRRQFDQYDHLFGYRNPEALDDALLRWQTAATPYERYNLAFDIEENHLIDAAATYFSQKFKDEVLPDELAPVIRGIYEKVIKEQNKMYDSIRKGQGSVYSTAPTLKDRLAAGDNVRLVSHDPDNEAITIELMEGGRRTTVTVHESALTDKVRPVDPTQTPNYYQPIDTRRFYLELKRNEEIIRHMSHPAIRTSEAVLADAIDKAGTLFNALWKPLQLFRLGWPQRVLMDEQARAMAILGIPSFARYYGSDELRAVNNAALRLAEADRKVFNALIHDPWMKWRHGRDTFNIGPGPVLDRTKRIHDPLVHEANKVEAPRVPESFMPKLDNARYAQVSSVVGQWDAYARYQAKRAAWQEQIRVPGSTLSTFAFGDDISGLTPVQARAAASGYRTLNFPQSRPDHPLHKIVQKWSEKTFAPLPGRWGHTPLGASKASGPMVFDPISARVEKSGYVVPLPHTKTHVPNTESYQTGLEAWYAQHRELLGSTGYRIHVTPEGDMYVARLFSNRQRKEAQAMMEFTESSMFHLNSGKSFQLKDWNDLTPTTEAAYREFVSTREYVEQGGDAPYGGPKRLEGSKTLYHGTYDELPDDLLPRDSAPLATGRMVGEGFYTTTNREVAEGFAQLHPAPGGQGGLYVLKGSKDGRTYKIFDMDKVPSKAELKRITRWVEQNADDVGDVQFIKDVARWMQDDSYNIVRYYSFMDSEPTFLDFMVTLSSHPSAQRLFTRYLEEQHAAGALTHTGGHLTGNRNRVYVWLDPENLLVRPLYVQGDDYVPFLEWLDHPSSREVPIPENRIIRTGVRNPLYTELRTLHRRIAARKAELKGQGKGSLADPEFRAMVVRERGIMEQLGLEYRHNAGPEAVAAGLQLDDFVITDPDRFGRTYDEALTQNLEIDAAARASGELRSQELGVEDVELDFTDLDLDMDSIHDRVLRNVIKRRESGKGWVTAKSADGEEFTYRSAYEGHDGELFQGLVSSRGAVEALSDGHGAATSLLRRQAVGHKTYNPPVMTKAALTKGTKENRDALEYFHQWSDLLNTQIAHSPIWNKMLNGWSDEKIVRWLDETPEGAVAKRDIMHEGRDTELWVNEHRAKLDYYLPSKKLQRLLGKERVNASQLRREILEEDYPDVFGPDVEFLDKRQGAGKALSWIADRIWYGLGTVPIDTFSRHPFARAMYDMRMRTLIGSTDSKWLDGDLIAQYERQARNYARDQVRKTLWELSDQTNFTDALRFMAPFWGAQQEAMVKWGKIVVDRPETVFRAFNLQRAVRENLLIINEDGEPVERGYLEYHPTDRVIIRLPEAMQGTALGRSLMTIGEIGIPIGSANTVLQGEQPLLPGPGPVLTIPADKFLRATSETFGTEFDEEFLYRWLFPVGRPQHGGMKGILDQMLPGWGKRVSQLQEGDGGISYSNTMTEVAREMELRNAEKGLPPPTPEEIEHQTKFVFALRIVAGLTSPVQMQFRPKHQFLIDAAHKYQRDYGINWFDKFMEDYGTAVARYATSSSNSTVGVPPTAQGMEDWEQNKSLIQEFPEWGGAIISPDAYDGEFSSDAYYAQFQINLGPGDDTTIRESMSQRERFEKADARAGWYEFRQVDATLDAELAARGLHSLQQVGAEDLMEIKRNFIADLTKRLPAWRAEYDNFNNDIYTRVAELNEWAFRPEFDNRPDIQGVRQYLMLREDVTAELDAYAASTGGSRSLQAEENAPLREWFYSQVGELAQANPAFAEFYSRYLTMDTLDQGSGGF